MPEARDAASTNFLIVEDNKIVGDRLGRAVLPESVIS